MSGVPSGRLPRESMQPSVRPFMPARLNVAICSRWRLKSNVHGSEPVTHSGVKLTSTCV